MQWQQMTKRQQDAARKLSFQYRVSTSQAAKFLDELFAHQRGEMTAEALVKVMGSQVAHLLPAKPTAPADILAALRAAGRTVRDIAAGIGVHASTVYRWLHGRTPNPRNSAALAAMA